MQVLLKCKPATFRAQNQTFPYIRITNCTETIEPCNKQPLTTLKAVKESTGFT